MAETSMPGWLTEVFNVTDSVQAGLINYAGGRADDLSQPTQQTQARTASVPELTANEKSRLMLYVGVGGLLLVAMYLMVKRG